MSFVTPETEDFPKTRRAGKALSYDDHMTINSGKPLPQAGRWMHDARRREGFWSEIGDDAVTNRTITLNDSEYRDVTAALQLLIDHCDVVGANGPADSRRQNCQALLQKLRSARS